jgi:hypothetical protein
MSPPGAFYNYSNPNFMIAGLIVEKVSGQTYRSYMASKVFQPLGMARTTFLPDEVVADGDYAYAAGNDSPQSYDNVWARPAGYAFSSVLDLAKFAAFLLHGNDAVLPAAQREAMQSPQVDRQEFLDLTSYGYGLAIVNGAWIDNSRFLPQVKQVVHSGWMPGYSSEILLWPDYDLAVVTLSNADGAYSDASTSLVFDSLAAHAPYSSPPDPKIDPASFSRFAGTYFDPHYAGKVVVTLTGSSLQVKMPDLDKQSPPVTYSKTLEPQCDCNFLLIIDQGQSLATFILGADGEPEYLRTRNFVAKAGQPPTTLRAPPEVQGLLRRVRASASERPALRGPSAVLLRGSDQLP